jgi:aryl-alcohol dehydrogenase-like predicted oxidoreductase
MYLALGTAQFGLSYGVGGRDRPVPNSEAKSILVAAHNFGIRTIDTAAAYGRIEEDLTELCCNLEFNIVSKIPAVPRDLPIAHMGIWVIEQAKRSKARLGQRLRHLMFHRADDLLEPGRTDIWSALADWGATNSVVVGASCYDPSTLMALQDLPGFCIAQVPCNALDQRIARTGVALPGVEIHIRSAFLQGLLLMPQAHAASRVPAAVDALAAWHDWCRERELEPLVAALSIVKSFSAVSCCVVGVDRLEHLEQIAAAWQRAAPIPAPYLHCDRTDVIDPRRWSSS